MKTKFEVIRDYDGVVDGYRLGEWYLWKHYYWNNEYGWVVTKLGFAHFNTATMHKQIETGEIIPVFSCKAGKELLIKMNGGV